MIDPALHAQYPGPWEQRCFPSTRPTDEAAFVVEAQPGRTLPRIVSATATPTEAAEMVREHEKVTESSHA